MRNLFKNFIDLIKVLFEFIYNISSSGIKPVHLDLVRDPLLVLHALLRLSGGCPQILDLGGVLDAFQRLCSHFVFHLLGPTLLLVNPPLRSDDISTSNWSGLLNRSTTLYSPSLLLLGLLVFILSLNHV